MKKFICLITIILSFLVFGSTKKTAPKVVENDTIKKYQNSITVMPGIRFYITRKELENTLKKKHSYSMQGSGGLIYVYQDIKGPLNYNYSLSSFLFLENILMSCMFSNETSPAEHKKMVEAYKNYYEKRENLTKIENKKANAILYFDSIMLLYIKRESGRTVVVIQVTNERNLKANMNEINSLKSL